MMLAREDSRFSAGAVLFAGAIVALLLIWRVVVIGAAALIDSSAAIDPVLDDLTRDGAPPAPDVTWREQIVRTPTNAMVFLGLAKVLEEQSKHAEAKAAYEQALRLNAMHPHVMLVVADFYLRSGDVSRALPILRRQADLNPEFGPRVWPIFIAELESGRGTEILAGVARENPAWWLRFFQYGCDEATDPAILAGVFAARAEAGVLTDAERTCLIGREQREGRWAEARELWLKGLSAEEQRKVDLVFNGDFESPLSNLGFDWIAPIQEGALADTQPIEGAHGQRALRVNFINKRYGGPPIYQYLALRPGRYSLEGIGRADALDSWLGLQWGLYCLPEEGVAPRQLVRTDPFAGSVQWSEFQREFAVPDRCPVQVLRLELANPRRDLDTPGGVPVRLRGTLWFDDLRVREVD
jgi:tetratricopeptide (TPR) repeat protein